MTDRAHWTAEDLDVFRRAYALSLLVHQASLGFPKIEQFGGLADQLRRSSKSICGLIVEGGGRQASSPREFGRYIAMAIGSAEEARLWCRYAGDLAYLQDAQVAEWRDEFARIIRMLQGLRASLARASSDH